MCASVELFLQNHLGMYVIRILQIFDNGRAQVLRKFLFSIKYMYIDIYIMQEPLYLGKFTLASIWIYGGTDPNNDSKYTKILSSCDTHQISIWLVLRIFSDIG